MLREVRRPASCRGVREAFAEMAAPRQGEGPPGRGEGVSQDLRWACENQGGSAELDWPIRARLEGPNSARQKSLGPWAGEEVRGPTVFAPLQSSGAWEPQPFDFVSGPWESPSRLRRAQDGHHKAMVLA